MSVLENTLQQAVQNVSRRQFLGGVFTTGAFVVASQIFPESVFAQDPAVRTRASSAPLSPSVYLGIEPDGTVFIVTHRSEMGTGIRTSLPLVAADELDADWNRVRIEQGLGDTKYGDQNTDGSRSIRDFYDAFRRAGAAAKSMLVTAAAQQWNVPAAQITVANHEVIHAASNRRVGFGSLVPAAAKLPVPKAEDLRFKNKSEWKYVGQERPIYDLEDITTGRAPFGLDIYREGMLFASIEHPPVVRGTVASVDDSETRKVKGVQETVTLDPMKGAPNFQPLGGVAVIGNSTWAVLQGRKKLKVTWNDGPNGSFNSTTFRQQLIKTAQSPAKVVRKVGDVDAEFARGGKVIESTYYTPMAAHASMEPPAAVADFKNGKVEVWTPTQNPQAAQETVAAALGIKKEDVTCHVTLLGGGFGRKSKPDFAAEAAVLSKKLGKPVKVIWTREDDIRHDFYHAASAVYHKATVDAKGKPTAWLYRSVFQPIASTFAEGAEEPLPFELDLGMTDMPYTVANLRGENGKAGANVRIGWFRAVTNNFHVFASSSFVDEMAHAAGRDPLEFLLDLIGPGKHLDLKAQGVEYANYGAPMDKFPVDTARLRKVLEVAAEKAGWATRRKAPGYGMGIAAHRSFNSYVASVVEVEMDGRGGFRVPRIEQVIDAGLIVNPDRVRTQLEGAAVMAVGMARSSEITAANGRIVQSNFNGFQVARMNDSPMQVNVTFIDNTHPPSGVGEPGLPPVIGALCNAIFVASGKRVRELPIKNMKLA